MAGQFGMKDLTWERTSSRVCPKCKGPVEVTHESGISKNKDMWRCINNTTCRWIGKEPAYPGPREVK